MSSREAVSYSEGRWFIYRFWGLFTIIYAIRFDYDGQGWWLTGDWAQLQAA